VIETTGYRSAGSLTSTALPSDNIRRASEELLRRGQNGSVMSEADARFRQLELALLLESVARAIEDADPLPHDVMRHAANLAQHVNSYPQADGSGSSPAP
jgi:hypothetical protein